LKLIHINSDIVSKQDLKAASTSVSASVSVPTSVAENDVEPENEAEKTVVSRIKKEKELQQQTEQYAGIFS
jgi:hypothetical protein